MRQSFLLRKLQIWVGRRATVKLQFKLHESRYIAVSFTCHVNIFSGCIRLSRSSDCSWPVHPTAVDQAWEVKERDTIDCESLSCSLTLSSTIPSTTRICPFFSPLIFLATSVINSSLSWIYFIHPRILVGVRDCRLIGSISLQMFNKTYRLTLSNVMHISFDFLGEPSIWLT